MKTKNLFNRILIVLSAFALMFFVSIESVFSTRSVKAEESRYSNVLDDLQKDENFNIEDYPSVDGSKDVKLLHIAETATGEFFVYIYQAGYELYDFEFTEIRIAVLSLGIDSVYKDYDLRLVSEESVFGKYLVEDFSIPDTSERYYNIVQISRPFDEDFDVQLSNGNVIDTIPYKISQRWKAVTTDDSVMYFMEESEVITITNKFVGYIRYTDHFLWFEANTDSHFVAFSTDKEIEDLVEVDIEYKYTLHSKTINWQSPAYNDEWEREYEIFDTVYNDDYGEAQKYFGEPYQWKRIEKTSDFLNTVENEGYTITQEGLGSLGETEWILRFYESLYSVTPIDGFGQDGLPITVGQITSYEMVSNVTILRLKFMTEGTVYNLGVVDNKQSGADTPIGSKDFNSFLEELNKILGDFTKIMKFFAVVIAGGLAVGVIVFVVVIVVRVFTFIGKVFSKLFKRKR